MTTPEKKRERSGQGRRGAGVADRVGEKGAAAGAGPGVVEAAAQLDPRAGPAAGADRLIYVPPGPVAAAYIRALPRGAGGGAGVIYIFGPIGSGKTRSMFAKMLAVAARQPRSPRDGIRRYKWAVVRKTYRDLWSSTIKSWWKQVPQDIGIWSGGKGEPAEHALLFLLPDGSELELIVDFKALGDNQDIQDLVAGYEPSSWALDEADQLGVEAIGACIGRAGRYPDKSTHGEPWWFGVLCVSNAWEADDEEMMRLYAAPPQGMLFFRQPGGFAAGAENLHNLPAGYYDSQIDFLERTGQGWKRRQLIDNEFGYSRDGKPVFERAFSTDRHVSPVSLAHLPGRPLIIGADAGRKPAAIIGQQDDHGQWRILAELVAIGMAAPEFGQCLGRLLRERFGRLELVPQGWGDPASGYGTETSDETWMMIVSRESGVTFRAAPGGNDIDLRLAAVEDALNAPGGQGRPGLIIDPSCTTLIRAFASGYRFRRKKVAGKVYEDSPEKNDSSHPMDAAQNLLLGGGCYAEVRYRRGKMVAAGRPVQAATDFRVW